MFNFLLSFTAEEITGIVAGVCGGIVAIIGAIGKIINEQRRKNGNHTCCLTGRELKPRKKKGSSKKSLEK